MKMPRFLMVLSGALLIVEIAIAGEIQYVGSSTVGQVMKEAAKVYKKSTFNINTKPESSGGEDAAVAGRTDLGGVARELNQSALDRGVKKFLIGKDAIGILVHPSNPVSELSIKQLADIFTGSITNWKDVGGIDSDIDVYIVNPRSATRKVFSKAVLRGIKYGGKRIRTIRPDPKILEEVANNPAGIGQISFSFIGKAKVKRIKPDGQEASVNNTNYPITRNLYLVTKGEPKGEVKEFIDWTLSDEGQKIVKIHFIGAK